MFPSFKLAAIFVKLAKNHGSKVLHGGDINLLTKDLGDALRRQKKIIQDPDMGVIETADEALPVIAEVKILTFFVAKKLKIETSGKNTITILEEIVQKTESRDSKAAKEIRNTLDWTREFFSKPEIQEILKADLIQIETPGKWTDIKGWGKSAVQGSQRIAQELSRLQDFLKHAKDVPEQKYPPKPANDGPKA